MSARTALIEAIADRLAAIEAMNPQAFNEQLGSPESIESAVGDMAGPVLRRVLQDEMTDELGPYYTTAGLMRRWKVSRQAVSKRTVSGNLLALTADDGEKLFPVWQFRPGSTDHPIAIEGMAEVREILSERNSDPLSHAIWLTAKVFGRAEDLQPAYKLLMDARGAQQVRSAARADILRLREGRAA